MKGQEWFDGAGFGMFIHWSHISNRGLELSWPMTGGAITLLPYATEVAVDDYYSQALDFAPRKDAPRQWMELAAAAGMRYAVLTTKHHDGFALWPSKHSDFTIAQSAYDGDLVAEYVDAARDAGLHVGFYYSLSDWHHPDYPAFREEDKPYMKYLGRRSETWDVYIDAMFGQIRELLTNYGQIDVLWFDGQWERQVGEWKADELGAMIRELQPQILINDRLPSIGDYATPEQAIPAEVPDGRWETCMTMNKTWAYCPADQEYKSSSLLLHTLCETAGKGGNFLLNVGPRGDGSLPPEQVERLQAIASWMEDNSDAIHDTQPGLEPWQFYGPSTRKDDRIFLHCVMRPIDGITVRGIPTRRLTSARELATGKELEFKVRATAHEELGRNPIGEAFITMPSDDTSLARVVELTISPS